MGLSFGSSSGSTSQSTQSSGTGSEQKTFSPWQTFLQSQLGQSLSQMLTNIAGGGKAPGVQAEQNAGADQINSNFSGLQDRTNKFLAARGFGKSGTAGSSALKTELGRQGALAGNEANYSGIQQQQNQGFLQDALKAAFNEMGATGTQTGQQSGNASTEGSNFGVGGSAVFKF